MVELLLNTLYATCTGDWDWLLECVRDVARYAFAYYNHNYARYLTPWLSEMLTLETIFQKFIKNLKKEISHSNNLRQIHSEDNKSDKVIETTINKGSKTPAGLTGCSSKSNRKDRWTINASYCARFYSHLQEFL